MPWMGMRTGTACDSAKQGLACSSWPWVRWMPGPLTFSLRVSFCAWGTEGPLCMQGAGTGPRHSGELEGRVSRQRRGWRPRCHRVLCCSHGHPRSTTPAKASAAAGARAEDIPQVTLSRASPCQEHPAAFILSCLLSSPGPPPPRPLCTPELSAGGWAGGDGGAVCWKGVRCAVSWD